MKKIIAYFFRFLFRFRFFRKRFFGIHKHLFYKYRLFENIELIANYQGFKLQLKLDDWIQGNLFFLREYEQSEIITLNSFLKSDSVFLDLGANIGIYSLQASKKLSNTGKIISFEPFSINFDLLKKHIDWANLSQVKLEKKAVRNINGFLTLYHDKQAKNLGMVTATYSEFADKEDVEQITIDTYVEQEKLSKIDVIKIDIEGFEYETLLGMEKTLSKFKPVILMEVLTDNSPAETYLQQFGYQKWFISDNGSLSKTSQNPNRRNFIFKPE